ncbi:hypothetical protein SLA2020_342610 [Shorea laevis]
MKAAANSGKQRRMMITKDDQDAAETLLAIAMQAGAASDGTPRVPDNLSPVERSPILAGIARARSARRVRVPIGRRSPRLAGIPRTLLQIRWGAKRARSARRRPPPFHSRPMDR